MADDWAAEINGDQDDEEALRIAIAMSLGRDPSEREEGGDEAAGVIDLTQDDDGTSTTDDGDDDDDDDNVVEVGAGARDAPASKHIVDLTDLPVTAVQQPPAPAPTQSSGLSALGLDRKSMEAERLARLSKRKASQLEDVQPPPPPQRPRTEQMSAASRPPLPSPSTITVVPEKNQPNKPAEPKATTTPTTLPLPQSKPAPPRPTPLPFPRGVVKKTWAYGQPRRGDDIKIEEVLQKQHLELAVLSSFQWDEVWLLSKVDLARTKLVLIAFAGDEAQKEEMRANVPRDRIRFCFPPMQPIGSMHSKLQLLKYEGYMRIVVPTGNLMSYDWGETGTMENMVFIIDLPKFQSAEERDAQTLTPFGEELLYFLRAQGLDEKLVASLQNYDFAETGRYQFVHTIPGSHTAEEAWRRTGYCGLGRAVDTFGLKSSVPIELDFVCASLGAVNYSLLSALYQACQGDSGLKEYGSRPTTTKAKTNAAVDAAISTVKRHMRIFFPSRDTVVQSKGGKDGAGTICFQSKWWKAATFPHELLRDCKSVRPGLLMHSKLMFVRPHGATADDVPARCFAYVGSANLSESAWGRLVRDRASGKAKMACRNWWCALGEMRMANRVRMCRECGVLVKAGDGNAGGVGGNSNGKGSELGVFAGSVPVPMDWPGQKFAGSARTPWFYQEG